MSRDGRKREGSKREKNGKRRAVKDGYIGRNVMKAEDEERKRESADPKKVFTVCFVNYKIPRGSHYRDRALPLISKFRKVLNIALNRAFSSTKQRQ